nr:restriction endonuclease subunit S [Marinobacter daepoensis]
MIFNSYFQTYLPCYWDTKKLLHLAEETQHGFVDGPFGSDLKSNEYQDKGTPLIQLNNIRHGQHILRNMKYIDDRKTKELIRHVAIPNDIVIAKMAEPVARAAIVSDEYAEYVIVADCVKLTPNKSKIDLVFLLWAINSDEVRIRAEMVSTGTTRIRINLAELKKLKVPYPPIAEQRSIAVFLDHETAKIDTLIEKQQQLIKLLKEKRQAVISHAVTKGLNTDAPMKDSGVEWLGEVPEHWSVTTLKHSWSVIDCKHLTAEFVDEGIPLASIREVKSWEVDLSESKKTTENYYQQLIDGNRKPSIGDIIYSRNATVGEAAKVSIDIDFAMGQDVCLIRKIKDFDTDYLLYQLKSPIVTSQLDSLLIGSTFKRINVEDIRNFLIASPTVDEQREISSYLNQVTHKHDSLIGKAQSAIELMQERRTALISAAVTGKIDVRNWTRSTD